IPVESLENRKKRVAWRSTNFRFVSHHVSQREFTQRRKDRKDAKARPKNLTRLCVFAIFASLRETFLQRITEPKLSQSPIERRAIVVEYLRGLFDVAAGAFERLGDRLAFDVFLRQKRRYYAQEILRT